MTTIRWIIRVQIICLLFNLVIFVIEPSWLKLGLTGISLAAFGYTRFVSLPLMEQTARIRELRQREHNWFIAQLNIRCMEIELGLPLSELVIPHKAREWNR